MGARFLQMLQRDPLYPVFKHGLFRVTNTYWLPEVARFTDESFAVGVDHRLVKLLEHVDACIAEHTESAVLIDMVDG